MVKNLYIFALAAHGEGLSGSDRIFIELSRRWSKSLPINIYVWEEGLKMCQKAELNGSNIYFHLSHLKSWKKSGFLIGYIVRVIEGVRLGFSLQMENLPTSLVYSSSEFWMDSLPALLLKLRNSKISWIAAWFQTAPKPWIGFAEGDRISRYRLNSFIYWFVQTLIKPLIAQFADFVLVNNDDEKKQFPRHNLQNKALVVRGAVDIKRIEKWKSKIGSLPKIYDAVFQGRFHPQKGVLELIDIWSKVVRSKKDAKLVMIGDGPLREKVEVRIKNLKLEENIILTGYLFDGEDKYSTLAKSKIVVHPAFYDSGGMAAAEAMAFEIPAVGFNLKSFQIYYPEGMIKVKLGDLEEFAKAILNLLNDEKQKNNLGREALEMIENNWSWDNRAREVLKRITLNI